MTKVATWVIDADQSWLSQPIAVLVSGGLDSAILVGELSRRAPCVVPIYVRFGLMWEEAEEAHLRRFLDALGAAVVQPLRTFSMPIRDVYGLHWSTTGENVPDDRSADEAVFLPGRNLLLTVQAAIWCHLNGVYTLALGPLASNPFPDASDTFFTQLENVANEAVGGRLRLVRPFRTFSKRQVMEWGRDLPLGESFSCLRPVGGRHCGVCNKCGERRAAFADAGLPDPTLYAHRAGQDPGKGRGSTPCTA